MKTRKGGKTASENLRNYNRFWRNYTSRYNPQVNYPGARKSLFGKTPMMRQAITEPNTYWFQRHGFSCANLLKEKKSYQQYTDPDPSLCTYGIVSLLRNQPKPAQFKGKVFVSSLIRTLSLIHI